MPRNVSAEARNAAVRQLNDRSGRVLISLVRSQTVDLFAENLGGDLRNQLEALRSRSPDGVKVAVDRIERDGDGYLVTLDAAAGETLRIKDTDAGPFARTLGGGLCNLSKDLEVILDVLGEGRDNAPRADYLTWADAGDSFPGTLVDGLSRTSLIFQSKDFEKLIVTQRGPTYDAEAIDLWQQETDFYGSGNDVLFVGQEPQDSRKFDAIMQRKLKDKGLRVFWLVGGNQLKQLYTEYRSFLSIVDVVSLNLSEAAQFFAFEPLGRRHKDATELRIMYAKEISRRILDYGANYVVITDGAKGASLARKARGGQVEFVYSPLIQENSIEVDPAVREDTGCGDSFAASIGAYFLTGGPIFKLNEAANFAHYIAGIIYQRARPHLTDKDRGFVEYALTKARASGAFVGKHETFKRNHCQIRPATIMPRGPRNNVLVLILGGNPADPDQPAITGAGAAVENLARAIAKNEYPLGPLVHVVPRVIAHPSAQGRAGMVSLDPAEMQQRIESGRFCPEIGDLEGRTGILNGVLTEDLSGAEGVYVLRAGFLEAMEILSSEDFADLFADIKIWHFATENIDERLVWHTKRKGVSREQSQEVMRQALRDNMIRAQEPQVRFAWAHATNLDDFEREMTEELIRRLDALLAGVFRG
ncbi:carbohydrate kinase family protein [Magnetospira sp. QH-2]|uniref:carbohydrate kinase family protein n=1 Tax=Magnetospira sp. (strain QH-2) TaxID=1288970 RepID=UPI0003E81169|nr:carbohydrate kinase family protein [Magnetospira sp. QH-2]CCQ72449.1 Putative Sugar kinases (ribokinase family, fragment) [Magnetospira sp. QH-2]